MLTTKNQHTLDPKSIAIVHQERLHQLRGEAGTSKTHILFKNGTTFAFDLNSAKPNYRSFGEKTSFSYRFANDVKEFTIEKNGFTVVFKDNSRWQCDPRNSIAKTS